MRAYFSYFKSEILVGLQYKAAALGGLSTQLFWGVILMFIYHAFYSYSSIDSINFKELMCYLWLGQSFFSLTIPNMTDYETLENIRNGVVAYELCRPYDLYIWWFLKQLSKRLANCMLRCLPIIILAFLLPEPYNLILPGSFGSFLLFIITMIFGVLIIVGINMIVLLISFFTYNDKGISSIVTSITCLLSGFTIPLPLLPDAFNNICKYLPFRLICDSSYRVYSLNIPYSEAFSNIVLQIIWIIILIFVGRKIMRIALKKVEVQGG